MQLAGKTALVTGGAARVGREIARALAARGMRIIIHYNNSERAAEEAAAEIVSTGAECLLLKADLRSKMQIDELAAAATKNCGAVDLLVNNAAVYYKTP